tara:strand:+ start:385 stop:519 length:135 start_codon:yes stop_codon:yes gene_type:complete
MKLTRRKNKRRLDSMGKGIPELKHPNKLKRICKGWSNKGLLGKR